MSIRSVAHFIIVLFLLPQVDVVYQKCELTVEASCNCAVAIQSGDDVIVIDRCYRERKVVPLVKLDGANVRNAKPRHAVTTRMTVQLYINDKLTPATKVFQEADGKKYFVSSPLWLNPFIL